MLNPYGIVILTTLLLRFVLESVSNALNLKSLHSALPPELHGLYDAEQYNKSQEYTRVRTRFGIMESIFDLAVLLVFWFLKGFPWLDAIVRSWNFSPLWTGLSYIALLTLASGALSLPFQIYSTFVIEEHYGFNRTTAVVFITDRLKALLLTVALGGPLLAAILWFFEYTGASAWLWCWLISIVFILIVQFIAPTWILPLFNKYTPLQEGDLKNAIHDYAQSVGFSFKDIFVMDGSKRSSKANAFFTGFGKNKRIALFDTLIAGQTTQELLAVLAHEIGHYKKKHVIQATVLSVLPTGILFFLLSVFLSKEGLFAAFGMRDVSVYAGLIFFGMLYETVSFLLSIGMNALSRHNEFAADRYAVDTGQNPEYLISSLKKLSAKNLSNLTPHPFYVFLNYSHPSLLQRIQALK